MQNPEFGNRVICDAKTVACSWVMVKWGKRWCISLASQRSVHARWLKSASDSATMRETVSPLL